MSETVEPTPEVVAQVSAAAGEGVTDEQVTAVLSALSTLLSGEDVGTVKRHPDGSVASRVTVDGMPVWWVVPPDGSKPYRNTQPVLPSPWEAL